MTPDPTTDVAREAHSEARATGSESQATFDGPTGEFLHRDGEEWYRIRAVHRMRPFLMTLASDTDLWAFVTSSGGLTAGRVDPDGAIFPYETVDRLLDGHHHTGPITRLRVLHDGGRETTWQPFSDFADADPHIDRNLEKNVLGNRLRFEEIHHGLDLAFHYRWVLCDEFGLVRTAVLTNRGNTALRIALLDGVRNILPAGAPLSMYQASSSLVDAYKRSELDPLTGLAIYCLTSRITDRAEAAEQLRSTVAWSVGLDGARLSLDPDGIGAFRRGEVHDQLDLVTGRRGNYLLTSELELPPGTSVQWHIVMDTGRSQLQVAALRARLLAGEDLEADLAGALDGASDNLARILGSADGFQVTNHPVEDAHHLANVLFNTMRGGVFTSNHAIPMADLADFIRARNSSTFHRHAEFFRNAPPSMDVAELHAAAAATGDADFVRHALEYLPIFFGRRHGDPSRPWNRFSIRVRNADGERLLRYEGNWRDIFQNWEALSLSFTGFLPGIIARFVNASTVDGFNPYRVTRDGIDWEVPEPDNPWSHIGYWGDHQVIYLLRFLEALDRTSPGALEELLPRRVFCYANVPYRLRSFEEILAEPRETIVFDRELAAVIDARVRAIGSDGKLVIDDEGDVVHVTLLEKLLVTALARLSNLVPGGGIWMNTQRPEWNDANNALVGNGCSMVTLCYLRRYLSFLARLVETSRVTSCEVNREVVSWFEAVAEALEAEASRFESGTMSAGERLNFLRSVGEAFSRYRQTVFANGFSGCTEFDTQSLVAFCRTAVAVLDRTIEASRRPDGLYHSYNIIALSPDRTELAVRPLDVMLEGQVAALSSGALAVADADAVLRALFASRLYRSDQKSFLLYPARDLPGFLEKNQIPESCLQAVPLLRQLVSAGEKSILAVDVTGNYRFSADFSQAGDLSRALDRISEQDRWRDLVAEDRGRVLDVYEDVFQHHAFTGRSGVMYAYEGLGSIYWHMVSKLLLAVQEVLLPAIDSDTPQPLVESLLRHYDGIRSGLGFMRSPAEFGAFPTDPYSHTPAHAGAQQPGMTGQVKEEILTRFGELGVAVEKGLVRFHPTLLRDDEFRRRSGVFRFFDIEGREQHLEVSPGQLAFSFCQVPVVYERVTGPAWIQVVHADGSVEQLTGNRLGASSSLSLLRRDGRLARIEVGVTETTLRTT